MLDLAPDPAVTGARLIRGGDASVVARLLGAIAAAPALDAGVHLIRGAGACWNEAPHLLATRLATVLRPWSSRDEIRAFDNRTGTVAARPLGAGIIAPGSVAKAIGSGGTVVFQKVDSLDFNWHRLARAFEGASGKPAQVNIYAGAANARGLAWHRDPHDVLILQLAGMKRFQVEGGGGAIVDIRLRPGDLLWLGRGVRHQAVNGNAGSIHASLGLLHWTRGRDGMPITDRRQLAPPIPSCPLNDEERGAALLAWRPLRDLPSGLAGGTNIRPDLLALIRPLSTAWHLDVGARSCALASADVRMIEAGACPPGERHWLGTHLSPAHGFSDLLNPLYPGGG